MIQQQKKTIALVAHDARKFAMLRWVRDHHTFLEKFNLVGTSRTSKTISEVRGLNIESLDHGVVGGDIRIANRILDKKIDILIFFVDTMTPHGHENDIQSLIRTATTMNIPFALNSVTADLIVLASNLEEK